MSITSPIPSPALMSSHDQSTMASEGAAFPWILEHLLTYPGTYEIPLRTMYTLNAATQTQQQPRHASATTVPGNAFPRSQTTAMSEQQNLTTATAAAQLRANLTTHIAQIPSQPTSLPPSFITSFVRRCFPSQLDQVDFPQALTAMDYLKDLEVRRRREVVAALDKLGIDRSDIGNQESIAKKYPGVMKWVTDIEENERKVEALYTQVYVGMRRWTLINELSLTPFNKANCIAMLNTLYPPTAMQSTPFVQPTAQLTSSILSNQRNGFFRYITAVEQRGTSVLSKLIDQHKRPQDATGWTILRETLDNYLRMATSIIDECLEITGCATSPSAASFTSIDFDEDKKRKVDSGISFGSTNSSNRNSAQSHTTRPSTSSSYNAHSRKTSKEKQLPDKPLPMPSEEENVRPAGSTLERIARELRKIRSKSNVRDESRHRPATAFIAQDEPMPDMPERPTTPSKNRTLGLKRSLKKMRSNGALRENGNSRPTSRDDGHPVSDMPVFDAEEMKRKRQDWEKKQAAMKV